MQTEKQKITESEKVSDQKIIDHLQTFLLSLRQGFASMGKHYPILIEDQESNIDLLMYHAKLRCYIAVECKKPQSDMLDLQHMNSLLPAIDRLFRHPQDDISIGLIVCQIEDKVAAEYVFTNIFKSSETSFGAASHLSQIVISLPDALKEHLPPTKKIEEELSKNVLAHAKSVETQ